VNQLYFVSVGVALDDENFPILSEKAVKVLGFPLHGGTLSQSRSPRRAIKHLF
jgi:hypothetical protein